MQKLTSHNRNAQLDFSPTPLYIYVQTKLERDLSSLHLTKNSHKRTLHAPLHKVLFFPACAATWQVAPGFLCNFCHGRIEKNINHSHRKTMRKKRHFCFVTLFNCCVTPFLFSVYLGVCLFDDGAIYSIASCEGFQIDQSVHFSQFTSLFFIHY